MKPRIGQNYTRQEIEAFYGPDWRKVLGFSVVELPKKPKISSFEQFDENTKSVYVSIKEVVEEVNNGPAEVYATGSRVKGYWKTAQEAQELSERYGRNIKESDYDYYTTAPIKPSASLFMERLGVKVDHIGSTPRVLIQ